MPVPPRGIEVRNAFAAFAEDDSEGDSEEQETTSEVKEKVADFSEAEAEQVLEELLNGWVHSCPVVGGSTRQAAVDREVENCAAALLAIRMCAPRRA